MSRPLVQEKFEQILQTIIQKSHLNLQCEILNFLSYIENAFLGHFENAKCIKDYACMMPNMSKMMPQITD